MQAALPAEQEVYKSPVPPQRKCFQIASMLIGRERKVIAN